MDCLGKVRQGPVEPVASERQVQRMNAVLRRAQERRARALRIIKELDLVKRWSQFGKPVIVGSVRNGLVVAPDIEQVRQRIQEGYTFIAYSTDGVVLWSHFTGAASSIRDSIAGKKETNRHDK